MPKYKVIVKQIEETLYKEDVEDLPAGPDGLNSEEEYYFAADSEDEALDQFHLTIPISDLECFEITAEKVQ